MGVNEQFECSGRAEKKLFKKKSDSYSYLIRAAVLFMHLSNTLRIHSQCSSEKSNVVNLVTSSRKNYQLITLSVSIFSLKLPSLSYFHGEGRRSFSPSND